jgi:nitrogen fixation protein FixH
MKNRLSWGVGVAAAYIVFAAGTTAVVVFAMHRPVDLVSPDYYAQELRQDERAAAVANAAALGRDVGIEVTREEVRLRLPRAQTTSARGSIHLYRASSAADDREFTIAPDATGVQRVNISGLAGGEWIVKVQWTAGGRAYYLEQAASLE